jgi:MOSC domain-containing protein YiiM
MRRRPRATIVAVCVGEARVHRFAGDREERTAIDKRPVAGAATVGEEGLSGDTQVDRRFHGGVERAVYAYAEEDAAHWEKALRRDVPPGLLGENLRLRGLDVSGAHVGERWVTSRGLVLEVSGPRMPCRTLQGFLDVPDMIARFNSAGRPGAYLRVITTGEVAVGDGVTVQRDAAADAAPTVADIMAWRRGSTTTDQLRTLAALEALASDTRRWAAEALAER